VNIAYERDGVMETVGDQTGAVTLRVRKDLERFKEFIKLRTKETGAWRGEVPKT
jgi:hypothetical protein